MRALTAIAALFAINGASAAPLAMTEEQGVRWVCGGVGAEERREIAALEPQANLRLLFVTQKRGGYLADAEVALSERGAAAPRVSFRADGPICLLKVPAGDYVVKAKLGGKERSAQVKAGAETGKPAGAVFAFPPEPWDGIWASDEEKQGARKQ